MQSVTRTTLFFAVLAATLSSVAAHGTLSLFKADGVEYTGPLSNQVLDSPIRMVTDVAPTTDLSSNNMQCGPSAATSATQTANVTAGSSVTFGWRSGSPPTPWPHVRGPVLTYMAKCSGAAADCAPSGLDWFKIDEQGFFADGSWTQKLYNAGETTSALVPKTLQNGEYLMRHEIIALHVLPAEYYVSCIQVQVSGGQDAPNNVPADFTRTFPNGYSLKQDPGIGADVFSNFQPQDYVFPGPKMFFADDQASAGAAEDDASGAGAPLSTSASPSASKSSAPSATTSSAPSSTPSKVSCKAKRARSLAVAGHKRSQARSRLPRNH